MRYLSPTQGDAPNYIVVQSAVSNQPLSRGPFARSLDKYLKVSIQEDGLSFLQPNQMS